MVHHCPCIRRRKVCLSTDQRHRTEGVWKAADGRLYQDVVRLPVQRDLEYRLRPTGNPDHTLHFERRYRRLAAGGWHRQAPSYTKNGLQLESVPDQIRYNISTYYGGCEYIQTTSL